MIPELYGLQCPSKCNSNAFAVTQPTHCVFITNSDRLIIIKTIILITLNLT